MRDPKTAFILLVTDAILRMQGKEEITPMTYRLASRHPRSAEISIQIRRINEAIAAARDMEVLPHSVPKFSRTEQSEMRKNILALHKLEMVESVSETVKDILRSRLPGEVMHEIDNAVQSMYLEE